MTNSSPHSPSSFYSKLLTTEQSPGLKGVPQAGLKVVILLPPFLDISYCCEPPRIAVMQYVVLLKQKMQKRESFRHESMVPHHRTFSCKMLDWLLLFYFFFSFLVFGSHCEAKPT